MHTSAASRSISPSGWAAVKVKRSRAVPAGTVGGRMAVTRMPSASNNRDATYSPQINRLFINLQQVAIDANILTDQPPRLNGRNPGPPDSFGISLQLRRRSWHIDID